MFDFFSLTHPFITSPSGDELTINGKDTVKTIRKNPDDSEVQLGSAIANALASYREIQIIVNA